MFCECDRLLYVEDTQKKNFSHNNSLDFSKINSEYVKLSEKIQKEHFNETEKSNIFNHNLIDQGNSIPSSISLVSDNNISDIYKILGINRTINSQIYNITKMISMFSGCSSLISVTDISKWNTSNVEDMGYIFNGCSSITSLPDISKWNTSNVKKISYMFCGCTLLITLPDISKWNTSNFKILVQYLGDVSQYYHYLIYQNGILLMSII